MDVMMMVLDLLRSSFHPSKCLSALDDNDDVVCAYGSRKVTPVLLSYLMYIDPLQYHHHHHHHHHHHLPVFLSSLDMTLPAWMKDAGGGDLAAGGDRRGGGGGDSGQYDDAGPQVKLRMIADGG